MLGSRAHTLSIGTHWKIGFILIFGILFSSNLVAAEEKKLGELMKENGVQHNVHGDVYQTDDGDIVLKKFTYDGLGPAAFFWVGTTAGLPNAQGTAVQYPLGSNEKLREFNGEEVKVTLPAGMKIKDITYFSVWCKAAGADFAHIILKEGGASPKPPRGSGSANKMSFRAFTIIAILNFHKSYSKLIFFLGMTLFFF